MDQLPLTPEQETALAAAIEKVTEEMLAAADAALRAVDEDDA